jgi:Plasmid pRiA4b ORF-3-like protein
MPILDPPVVYQLRIRLNDISPLIWRRLLVTRTTSIADLHAWIQTACAWSDSYLHRFMAHDKSYGITYSARMSFVDDPNQLRLTDFRFRSRCEPKR